MTAPILTPAARRHAARMAQAIGPYASSLNRQFRLLLRRRLFNGPQIASLLAITPTAAAQCRSLTRFLEQVDIHGRTLANLNVPPAWAEDALREFGTLLDPVLRGRFQPAREQVELATILTI